MAEGEGRGTGVEDLLLIILILAALGIAWFVAGGPAKADPSDESPFLLSPIQIGQPSSLSPLVEMGDSSYRDDVENASSDVVLINGEVTKAISPAERSALYGKIIIVQSTGGLGGGSAGSEYITLRASGSNTSGVTISGWTLVSGMTGMSATIPQGTRIPQTGSVNYEEPILLGPGEEAVIVSGRSPIGVSFKESRCTGYLSQFQDYTPSLDMQCPAPDAEITYAPSSVSNDNKCLSFLEGLSRCRIETAPLPDNLSTDCRNFIGTHITYNGCVMNHRNEPTFLEHTWRVYLRYDQKLWKERREVIKLLDESGKTVDVFTY